MQCLREGLGWGAKREPSEGPGMGRPLTEGPEREMGTLQRPLSWCSGEPRGGGGAEASPAVKTRDSYRSWLAKGRREDVS